jgi:hypothetical protein
VLVTITDTGRDHARSIEREIDAVLIRVFGQMGKEDAREYIRLSNRFLDILEQHPLTGNALISRKASNKSAEESPSDKP